MVQLYQQNIQLHFIEKLSLRKNLLSVCLIPDFPHCTTTQMQDLWVGGVLKGSFGTYHWCGVSGIISMVWVLGRVL